MTEIHVANNADRQYLEMVSYIIRYGNYRMDRTGEGARSIFDYTMRFDMSEGFPLLTTNTIHFKSILVELLWFLKGDTNIKYLQDNGVTIWDEWADDRGDLGPVYGHQWRRWRGPVKQINAEPTDLEKSKINFLEDVGYHEIDQIKDVFTSLKDNPFSRRHIVTAWNPADIGKMALPPCHCMFQFFVEDKGLTRRPRLSLKLTQRSADVGLGVPFNIASYAALLHMFAQQLDYEPGDLIWSGGDVHIYEHHVDSMYEQLRRKGQPLPRLHLERAPDLFSYTPTHFSITGYNPSPHIKRRVSV